MKPKAQLFFRTNRITTIERFYQNAIFADAAYIDFAAGRILDSRQQLIDDRLLTEKQADELIAKYEIVAIQLNTSSGFSATIFEERDTGGQFLAIRGTEFPIPSDLLAGLEIALIGAATAQYADLKRFIEDQRLNGTLNDSFTVTGHSLGGHLATLLKVDTDF